MGEHGVNRCPFVPPSLGDSVQRDEASDAHVRCESVNSCASINLRASKEQESELCEHVAK